MGVHVFSILTLPLTSLPTPSLGNSSAPALSTLSHASNLDWRSLSHMIIYVFQCYSLKSPHPRLLPQSPKDFHASILAWRNPTDTGAWRATFHGVAESDTPEQLSTRTIVNGGIISVTDVDAGLASASLTAMRQMPGCGLLVLELGPPVIPRPS